jgi:glycine/D-amino acid oxidase-like deaminating enzyme
MLITLGVGIAPLADGRLICGGTEDYGDETLPIADEPIAALRHALITAVPEAEALDITHKWCCFRPHNDDHMPVIDRLPGAANAWVVSGLFKTGLLMAPVIGELVTEWISRGSAPSAVESFALARIAARG